MAIWRRKCAVAADHFVETSLARPVRIFPARQRFIEEQLQQYQQKLTDAENALKEFKQKHIGMMPGQGGDYYAKLAETSGQLRQAQLDQQEAVNRRNQLKSQLADEEPELSAAAAARCRPTARSMAVSRRLKSR